jgi:hypothetical protein
MTHIHIHCSRYLSPGNADWQASCDCGDGLGTGDWESAMTWACGHRAFAHAGDVR